MSIQTLISKNSCSGQSGSTHNSRWGDGARDPPTSHPQGRSTPTQDSPRPSPAISTGSSNSTCCTPTPSNSHAYPISRDRTLYSIRMMCWCVLRHQDAIIIVDTESEELLFSWGQGEMSGPHDATWLENGHILIFDNGLGRDWSRVIELDPVHREIVWEYRAPNPQSFYTATRGSEPTIVERQYPGGRVGHKGRVREVTTDGSIVWEYATSSATKNREPAIIFKAETIRGTVLSRAPRPGSDGSFADARLTGRNLGPIFPRLDGAPL